MKDEMKKIEYKVGGVDSNYLSIKGNPTMARTLGGLESIQRLSPGKSYTYKKSESYEDDFEKDSKQELDLDELVDDVE